METNSDVAGCCLAKLSSLFFQTTPSDRRLRWIYESHSQTQYCHIVASLRQTGWDASDRGEEQEGERSKDGYGDGRESRVYVHTEIKESEPCQTSVNVSLSEYFSVLK